MRKTTPMMKMQHLRKHEESTWRSSYSDTITFTSSANCVDNCHLCLSDSHRASRCRVLSDATRIHIIQWSTLTWRTFCQETCTVRVPKPQSAVGHPQLTHSMRETEVRTAMAEPSPIHTTRWPEARTHIVQGRAVPRAVTKPHAQVKRWLMLYGQKLHQQSTHQYDRKTKREGQTEEKCSTISLSNRWRDANTIVRQYSITFR